MMRSTKGNPNENYPREILQLFTVGLFLLNQDGTFQLDGQGDPIPTYDQDKINNFTKVFTGWRDCRTLNAACPNTLPAFRTTKIRMEVFVASNHDVTSKTVMSIIQGHPFNDPELVPAAIQQLSPPMRTTRSTNARPIVSTHPNVGDRMLAGSDDPASVTSDPTPAYVGRGRAIFNNNWCGSFAVGYDE
jgi:uncharacterized protein (DUF1800 family)